MNCTLAKPNAGPTRQFVNTSAFRAPYGTSGNGIPNSPRWSEVRVNPPTFYETASCKRRSVVHCEAWKFPTKLRASAFTLSRMS